MQDERPHITSDLSKAIDELTAVTPSIVPQHFDELVECMRVVSARIKRLDSSDDANPDPALMKAFDQINVVRNRKDPVPKEPIESIPKLADLPGITPNQIAKMYGLVDLDGTERADLIRLELATPGTIIDPVTLLPREDIEGFRGVGEASN